MIASSGWPCPGSVNSPQRSSLRPRLRCRRELSISRGSGGSGGSVNWQLDWCKAGIDGARDAGGLPGKVDEVEDTISTSPVSRPVWPEGPEIAVLAPFARVLRGAAEDKTFFSEIWPT